MKLTHLAACLLTLVFLTPSVQAEEIGKSGICYDLLVETEDLPLYGTTVIRIVDERARQGVLVWAPAGDQESGDDGSWSFFGSCSFIDDLLGCIQDGDPTCIIRE